MTEDSLTDTEVLELVRGTHLAVFTVVSADGFAHSTPVWYLPEPAGSATILVDPESVKARVLRRDPRGHRPDRQQLGRKRPVGDVSGQSRSYPTIVSTT